MQAWLGLGANLQHPQAQLTEAIKQISHIPECEVLQVSSFYQTPPWGDEDQPDFINAVVKINTSLQAIELLHQMQAIENDMGRVRKDRRWGPRLIDIDLLLFGDESIESEELTLPHPRMHERAFVLLPLYELDPLIEIPGLGTAEKLLAHLAVEGIRKVGVSDKK
jgi:2-amino-4-hydroxy-6-hydroxymethyldihydropteridine diphosphokinase